MLVSMPQRQLGLHGARLPQCLGKDSEACYEGACRGGWSRTDGAKVLYMLEQDWWCQGAFMLEQDWWCQGALYVGAGLMVPRRLYVGAGLMVPRCFICWSRIDGAKVLYMLEQDW